MRDTTKAPEAGPYFAEVTIPNKKGLHARASAQFVRCAAGFTAKVRVTREGHTILIEAEGPEAEAALEALTALVEGGFGEED